MGYRYIGSKEKLAERIIGIIRDDNPNAHTVIDLMAGTGLFSRALRREGYTVVASDVMKYSYHHLVVQLLLNSAPEFAHFHGDSQDDRYQDAINYLNSLNPEEGYFFNEFSPLGRPKNISHSRMYFSSENAKKIDAIRRTIKEWLENEVITDIEHSLLLHDLIMATNDIANIAGTYGHYLSKMNSRAKDSLRLCQSVFDVNDNIVGHQIHCGYAEDLAQTLYGDVCYIDPPYIKRQYAANYHILETLAEEDMPNAIGESGLREWRNKYSNFCSKIKIRSSFAKILNEIHCDVFYVSYSEDGLLSLEELQQFLSQFGNVAVTNIPYKRFKSNEGGKGGIITEYLFRLSRV